MKTKKYINIIIYILQISILYTMNNINNNQSNWECDSGIHNYNFIDNQNNRELDKVVIRAKIWKIHKADSLFEMTENAIEDGFERLINIYKESNILVNLVDTESIYNDSLYYFAYNGRPFDLMRSHSIDSLINFYYLPNIDYTAGTLTGYGQAFNTPGNELFVAGYECIETGGNTECYDLANTFIPIHELGHCLGLFHTHVSTYGDEHVIRPNDENGDSCEVNCENAGDLLCDTEASVVLKNKVTYNNNDCSYISDEIDSCDYSYNPQIDNFMSYTHFECAENFTNQQIDKMFYSIENILPQIIISIGDLNDDLEINVLDALILLNAILANENISDLHLWLGDINNDISLDVMDIILLINIILEENNY